MDRLSDAAVLTGVIWFALVREHVAMAMLAALVLSLSLVVSYIKARAESLGFACNVGIAERPERVIVLGFALLLGHAEAGLWVLVAGTAIPPWSSGSWSSGSNPTSGRTSAGDPQRPERRAAAG